MGPINPLERPPEHPSEQTQNTITARQEFH